MKTKTTTKKPTVKKTTRKPVVKKTYKLEAYFNDKVVKIATDDLDDAIVSLKPPMLKTRLKLIVSKDKKKQESIFNAVYGKRLFTNKTLRNIFIQRLILK